MQILGRVSAHSELDFSQVDAGGREGRDEAVEGEVEGRLCLAHHLLREVLSRPAARPRLVRAHPKNWTVHVLSVHAFLLGTTFAHHLLREVLSRIRA